MLCPKCNNTMHPITVNDITADRCGSCDGIWFDLREHDHLKAIKGSEDVIDPEKTYRSKNTTDIRDINCPRCDVKLVKLAFPDQPHIQYEQCATCGGTFLDAGEFADWKQFTTPERIRHLLAPLR